MRFFSLRLAILLTIGVSLVNASCSPQNEVANRTERHSQGNGAFQNDAYVQHRTETSQGYAEVEVPESKASRFPIRYRIGSIDPRFNLSSDDALRATNQAIRMWESAANKQLFEYDPKDGFAIDFVFDQRQETLAARELAKEQLRIGKASLELSSEREQQAAAQFRNTRQRLESEEQAFNSRLDDYNRRVGTWNASGGAPADTISDLNSEKESIGSERARPITNKR